MIVKSTRRLFIRYFVSVVCTVCSGFAAAQNKVVVIPMAGDDLKPLKNIITVAKENGDFSDPVQALNSITDASDSNRYLVVIAPGVYDLSARLVIGDYISVAGSGRNATLLKSTEATNFPESGAFAAITVNDYSSLSDLSLEVGGTSTLAQVGIAGFLADDVIVSNVSVLMNNAGANRRIGMVQRAGTYLVRGSVFEVTAGSGVEEGIIGNFGATSAVITDTEIKIPNHLSNTEVDVLVSKCFLVRYGTPIASLLLDNNCNATSS